MSFDAYAEMARGTLLAVKYGKGGKQIARYYFRTQNGNLRVTKYRANSGTWTGLVTIKPSEVLRLATPAERAKVS